MPETTPRPDVPDDLLTPTPGPGPHPGTGGGSTAPTAPRAYWEDGTVSLYLGDCREILPALGITPDACVADPPYGETANQWDVWPDGWVKAVADVLPASASLWCFGSARMFLQHAADFTGWKFAQEALWVKRNGSGPTSRDRLVKIHEWAYHWYRGRWSDLHHEWEKVAADPSAIARNGSARRTHDVGHRGVYGKAKTWREDGTRQPRSVTYLIEAPAVRYQKRHPDEKPLAVVEALVRECVPPGGLVLDPFAGAGTTLLAAALLGRRAIGIESDERYAERAAERLAKPRLEIA